MQTQNNTPGNIVPFPAPSVIEPVVELVDGKPMTTSIQVAVFFKKEHYNVIRDIKNIIDAVDVSNALNFEAVDYTDAKGEKRPMYLMDKDAFTLLVMGYTGEEAMRFKLSYIRRFNEMEEALRARTAIPEFSNPAIAARAWAEEYERRQVAEIQRDEAIRTKSLIGSSREATSMATASTAVRKSNALADELGIGRNYRQVKAIEWLREEFDLSVSGAYSQIGKKLSELSARMGYPTRQVPDEKYPGGVKAYHIDVVDAFHALLRTDLNMLAKFRRR